MKRAAALILAVASVVATSGCSPPGDGGYVLTAYFPRAVALYAYSNVKVMGVDVGRVKAIEAEGDRIRVEMSIDGDVPLPADVQAAIVPLSLVGERNVVLHPAWRPGMAKARAGDVIPLERTQVPVEPDEALKAITDLAHAINPTELRRLIHGSATAVAGHGEDLNAAIERAANLSGTLASQDQSLLDIVANVHKLASTLNQRTQQLGKLLDDFAQATGVLASERESIRTFLATLVRLMDEGNALVTKYQAQLPGDMKSLAQVIMTVRVNSQSVAQMLRSLRDGSRLLIDAYKPEVHGVAIRFNMSPDALDALRPFLDLLGLSIPCVPFPGDSCPGGQG